MMRRRHGRMPAAFFSGEPLEKRACPAGFTLTPVIDTVTEGNAAEFRVTMDAASSLPQSVIVSTVAGTATLGVDYMHTTQELLFFPGETEKTFNVQSIIDPANVTEGSETLTVLVTPRGGTPSQLSAVMTINDYVPPDPFTIEFDFDGSVPGSVQALFTAAADLWENVIVGDLPDVILPNGIVVDDLLIQVSVSSDLPDGVIAGARFTDIRVGDTSTPANGNFSQNGLPYIGDMIISETFVTAVGLGTTIAHEIGHVLGFGSLWAAGVGTYPDLVSGIGTDDPIYLGANAVREYNQIFSESGTSVPLYEISSADPPAYDGSYGSHWRDSVFNDYPNYGELMTAAYPVEGDNGVAIPAYLSRVTVGALDDLGYVVSYLGAEAYVAPTGGGGGGDNGGGGGDLGGGGLGGSVDSGDTNDGGNPSGPGIGGPGGDAPGVPSGPGESGPGTGGPDNLGPGGPGGGGAAPGSGAGGEAPGSGDLIGGGAPGGLPGGIMGPTGPGSGSTPGGGFQPGSGGLPGGSASFFPRSLPPRITSPSQPPVILGNNPESQDVIRRSLDGLIGGGGLAPIDLAHLAAEQIARLAAWAEYERWAATGRLPGFGGALGGEPVNDGRGGDDLFGNPGVA